MKGNFQELTVSQLNFYVRSLLEGDANLNGVFLHGEISNFKDHYSSGHFYLTLKDDGAAVDAVIFRNSARRLSFMPRDGMRVIALGRASLYERGGRYQFYIDDMRPEGIGALYAAFEKLKEKLKDEGLFSDDIKKPLPAFPERIGVVTSPTGAAVRDIINVLGRRWPVARVIVYPALVQGVEAPGKICAGIEYFNREHAADVLIVGRGGGSLEDLWAFNDESVARCIAGSSIPVVSAVGHETDFSISDFAADVRAPTPSAAAELVSPDIYEIKAQLASLSISLKNMAEGFVESGGIRLDTALATMKKPVSLFAPRAERINALKTELSAEMKAVVQKDALRLSAAAAYLEAMSPLSVLARGYCVAYGKEGIISGIDGVEEGNNINVRFHDGSAECNVISKESVGGANEKV